MSYSIKEISELIDGKIIGDKDIFVDNLSPIKNASQNDLTFAFEEKYFKDILNTKAKVIIVPENITLPQGKQYITIIQNPKIVLEKLLQYFKPKHKEIKRSIEIDVQLGNNVKVSPNCYIGHDVTIDDETFIYPNVTILEGVTIGKSCIIYPNVTIREFVEIADNVIIQPGAIIGSDGFGYSNINGHNKKLEQIGTVILENDVEIGANVTIDRGAIGDTIIKSGTKIDNLVHIAHNDIIGEDCLIIAQVAIAGSVEIGKNCIIAGQVGIAGHIKIGDNCIIAAKSGVTNNIPDNSRVSGFPTKKHKEDLKIKVAMGHLPEMNKRIKKLEKKLEEK